MSVRGRILRSVRRLEYRREYRLFAKYAARTMVPADKFVDNVLVATGVAPLAGAVVECGVWRGGMMAALAETLREGSRREFVLFDSFQGLPPAGDLDGDAARAWQADPTAPDHHDNCRASVHEARASMEMAGVEGRFVEGWFDDTVPAYARDERPEIALLRLDADWYDSTLVCLRHLFPLVVPGGVVILDDYGVGVFDGCTRAVHDFLSETNATEHLRSTPNGVTYLVRR
jgi:O-methyltransferase